MLTTQNTKDELLEEIERLRLRIEESEAIVEAIRSGIVDAVVVNSTQKESVYTLEGAERPYRLLVEAMQQGVAVLSSEGVVVYCNLYLADLFQKSVENITGSVIGGFSVEADQAKFAGVLAGLHHNAAHLEVVLRRQDGTAFPAALTVSVLPLQKISLLVTDLTQQKHYDELLVSKAALLDSESRYRRLFETSKDGILILDTETGRITDANPFMGELLGYSQSHFLGKELWEIGLFSDKVANEAAVRTLQESGYIRYEHLPLETYEGLLVEVEIVANSYEEGRHKVIQCNVRDITQRSLLEKKMQAQADALADLHHRKDEFLAMLSHELRNPLAPIVNALQLLKLQKGEGEVPQKARNIIERQVGQLTRLVDDLLEVSRITTGRIHLQTERVELNPLVERALETTRPVIEQHKHELKVVLSPAPIWLDADPTRIEQVIVNLLTNAAKYTPDRGKISVAVERAGDDAVLRVTDTGVGIAPELLPHIFELFTQAEQSIDRSKGGLGIGLSLVQRLAQMHGGRVEVSSVLGQGSEFVVRIPIRVTPGMQPAATSQATTEPTQQSLRVLVVDDNLDVVQSLEMLLSALGYDVLTAYDGASAVASAAEFRPQAVLLDIGLPGIDGYGVTKMLRQNPELAGVTLVAMTGYGQDADRKLSHDAGFDYHLTKPADFNKLQEILTTVSEKATGSIRKEPIAGDRRGRLG